MTEAVRLESKASICQSWDQCWWPWLTS